MLYNEFRPQFFKQVKGQKFNKIILINQIKSGELSHTYTFDGLHGSGKTSVTKILARAVNCLHPKDGEPCNECESCKSSNNGANNDIIEIDAASFNKVDDVAKIKDLVKYPPQGKYKVVIMDEAHMLSTAAWNSLLTILENTPANVIFIFCTTEKNKIPLTILSRSMNLTFSNISTKEILENLVYICNEKKYSYEDEGLALISGISNGSMRDALSNLEKCVAYGDLTTANIADTLGLVDQSNVFSIVRAIVLNNFEKALKEIEELYNLGKDVYELAREILTAFRDINVYQITKNPSLITKDIKYVSAFEIKNEELVHAINTFYSLLDTIKNSDNKKVILDINVLKVCTSFTNAKVNEFTSISDIKKETKVEENSDIKNNDTVNSDKTNKLSEKEVEIVSNKENESSTEDVNNAVDVNFKKVTMSPTNNKESTQKTDNSKGINHFDYLSKKVDLLNSYSEDINNPQLQLLLFSNIFTKHNKFIIKSKDIDKLNKEDIIQRMDNICEVKLNIEFESVS